MATFSIGVTDFGDEFGACVFDLPGCATMASDDQWLVDMIPLAISEHLSWLDSHQFSAPTAEASDFEIVERVVAAEADAADGEFCFSSDLQPSSPDDLAGAVRLMVASRGDFKTVVKEIPQDIARWRPPPSALRVIHEWAPDVRTIAEIVDHVASSDFYYRTGLSDGPVASETDDELADLDVQRQWAIQALQSISKVAGSRVYRPQRPWQDRPEEWTVRKMLRRIIEHERFHTAEIQQRLTWLRLGLPGN